MQHHTQCQTLRHEAGAAFPQPKPLIESNGYRYYIVSILRKRQEAKALYCAMELSAHQAERIRVLDRLVEDRPDSAAMHRERKVFLSTCPAAFREFWAADGRYDLGFLPEADARELIRKI